MKKLSGLSLMRCALRQSTTPSTMSSATWMPAGQSWRAIDSARLRCAALAGAKPPSSRPPRREAVAPMNKMLPVPAFFIGAIDLLETRSAPSALTRSARSKSAGADLFDGGQDAGAGVVDEHVDLAEVGADRGEGPTDRRLVGDIAGVGAGAGKAAASGAVKSVLRARSATA